ncbi:MarR family winged helix-turn-helix transcriptional regulator [Dactylosporangium salmoneum]|uniref:MarR family winged helix-turn-helix transcriptional regulator n=1 Tax=Dactylosporangium salmoneum TaxID=53361 RepID=UPI0031D7711D
MSGAEELIVLLRQFNVEGDRFVDVFVRAHGLHRTDMNAVAHVWRAAEEREPLTAGELARRLSLSPAATTALLARLERAGHIERRPDPADRRRIVLHMRPSAQELAHAFFAPLGAHLRAAFSQYTREELDIAADVLKKALQATTQAADEAAPLTSEGAAIRP